MAYFRCFFLSFELLGDLCLSCVLIVEARCLNVILRRGNSSVCANGKLTNVRSKRSVDIWINFEFYLTVNSNVFLIFIFKIYLTCSDSRFIEIIDIPSFESDNCRHAQSEWKSDFANCQPSEHFLFLAWNSSLWQQQQQKHTQKNIVLKTSNMQSWHDNPIACCHPSSAAYLSPGRPHAQLHTMPLHWRWWQQSLQTICHCHSGVNYYFYTSTHDRSFVRT